MSPEHSSTLPDLSTGARTIHTPVPLFFKAFVFVLLCILATPLAMYLAWLLAPSTPCSILVLDKTSMDKSGVERSSLYWLMKHQKITKHNGAMYDPAVDFRGFVPLLDSMYLLTGLETLREPEVDSLSMLYDAAYYADTYGVSVTEWRTKISTDDRSPHLYGGLSDEDILFLEALRKRGKPVVAEFNLFASPTPESRRKKAEELLGVRWTGWTGRYFATLDTLEDPEFPSWIVRTYERQFSSPWQFQLPGIILVHVNGELIVLESGTYLEDAMPVITTGEDVAEYYGIPQETPYPFWFEVTLPLEPNGIVSRFELRTNQYGDSLLASYGLPSRFPAVIQSGKSPLFTYFCLDAADNPPPPEFLASFRGIRFFRWLFYDAGDPLDRRSFFWNYYFPLMSLLLEEITRESGAGHAQ